MAHYLQFIHHSWFGIEEFKLLEPARYEAVAGYVLSLSTGFFCYTFETRLSQAMFALER